MRTIRRKHIDGELVQMDGIHFVDCSLSDCVLQYGGGHVIVERTSFSGCHHVFVGTARMTVNYLEAMDLIPPDDLDIVPPNGFH